MEITPLNAILAYLFIGISIIAGCAWLIKTGDPSEHPRDEHEDTGGRHG